MTDRFKFRVWNNKMQKFHIVFSMHGIVNDTLEGYAKDDNFVLEQCTGLKDKNGKLIYEGDIVKLNGKYEIGVYPIVYDESCCEYILTKNDKFIYEFYWEVAENCEVIGNIHENKVLLKEQD